jgi:hypothetical protein
MVKPNICKLEIGDRRQGLRHSVDEGLAPDEADLRLRPRLGDKVLSPAEADLEPKRFNVNWEESREVYLGRPRQVQRKAWQQGIEQTGLVGP